MVFCVKYLFHLGGVFPANFSGFLETGKQTTLKLNYIVRKIRGEDRVTLEIFSGAIFVCLCG
jgi:hypothetical protein